MYRPDPTLEFPVSWVSEITRAIVVPQHPDIFNFFINVQKVLY